MKSKIFRFSLLSILCVYVTASAAFAHDLPEDRVLLKEVLTNVIIRVRDAELVEYGEDDQGRHYHTYTYTINGNRVRDTIRTEPDTPDPDNSEPDNNNVDPCDSEPSLLKYQHSHDGGNTYHSHGNQGLTNHETDCWGWVEDHTHDSDPSNVGTQSPNPNPTPNPPGGGTSQAVAESGTAEGTSSPQRVAPVATGSAPQETQPEALLPIRVTEYMVRDWGRGVWGGNLPQWIELQNPNAAAVNLKGYTFQYATRRFANDPYTIHTLTLASAEDDTDGFVIAGGGVAILVTHDVPSRRFSGIEASQVYDLDIENVLKRGWVLTDAEGREVHRIGKDAFNALRNPVAPPHQEAARVSYHVYPSEAPTEAYYYGYNRDIGSPGFYEPPVPKAPSAIRAKRVGTWAGLKQSP